MTEIILEMHKVMMWGRVSASLHSELVPLRDSCWSRSWKSQWWGWVLARVPGECTERVVVTFAMKTP